MLTLSRTSDFTPFGSFLISPIHCITNLTVLGLHLSRTYFIVLFTDPIGPSSVSISCIDAYNISVSIVEPKLGQYTGYMVNCTSENDGSDIEYIPKGAPTIKHIITELMSGTRHDVSVYSVSSGVLSIDAGKDDCMTG